MDYKKETGRRIRRAREGLDWTLADLSKHTDGVLSGSRISNYEQGLRLPGPQEARILGRALGISPASLMCLEDEETMSQEEADLLRSWRALPERDRRDYARRIAALALVYCDPIADEKLAGFKAPTPQKAKKSVS